MHERMSRRGKKQRIIPGNLNHVNSDRDSWYLQVVSMQNLSAPDSTRQEKTKKGGGGGEGKRGHLTVIKKNFFLVPVEKPNLLQHPLWCLLHFNLSH